MQRRSRERGFSLIEALVALAIVALTMTIGMALLAQQSDVTRRVRAHQEAIRIVESTLEGIRAGVVPLTSGRVEQSVLPMDAEVMTLWIDVQRRDDLPGLHEVVVEARYVVKRQTLRRTVRTLVWGSP